MIMKALQEAKIAHKDQRQNNKPYLTHLVRVASKVMLLEEATEEMVAAALLHDALEDQPDRITLVRIHAWLGKKVANLVKELTDESTDSKPLVNREAKLIKLCDRLDNIEEIAKDVIYIDKDNFKFCKTYIEETNHLLNVLKGTHPDLETDISTSSQIALAIIKLREMQEAKGNTNETETKEI